MMVSFGSTGSTGPESSARWQHLSSSVSSSMERQGRVLRVFEPHCLEQALTIFVNDFKGKRLFPELKRLIVREYPEGTGELLKKAGFSREMNDYVLYR